MRPDILISRTLSALRSFETRLLILGCVAIWCLYPSESPPPEDTATFQLSSARVRRATFLAVGDIMLSRGVANTIDSARDPLEPFSELKDLLSSTDFNFGNLESPVSGNDARVGKGLVFNTRKPDIEGLVKNNFKIVNLANNHALDQGLAGLDFTRKFLTDKGIKYVGAGEDKAAAWAPRIVTANGIRIGFIGASYTSINDGGVVKNDYVARIEDIEHLRASIGRLKGESDFIVVTMHAGIEYMRKPDRSQVDFARAAVDAGADLVIGAHPHWIQTLEQYQGKYIFYSLGNFIFDQRKPDTVEGLTLNISLLRDGANKARLEKIELVPVIIERVGVPRRATEAEARTILGKSGMTERVLRNGF
jgi:poly-gamma-glutamate capsule biosynthesis protein CapA/YwtB (metallophosphatase superfamily)